MSKLLIKWVLKLFGFKKYDVSDEYPKPIVEQPVAEKQEHFLLSEKAKKPVARKPRITANKTTAKPKAGRKVAEKSTKVK